MALNFEDGENGHLPFERGDDFRHFDTLVSHVGAFCANCGHFENVVKLIFFCQLQHHISASQNVPIMHLFFFLCRLKQALSFKKKISGKINLNKKLEPFENLAPPEKILKSDFGQILLK